VALYQNRAAQGFDQVSPAAGLAKPTYPYVGWGAGVFDVDNDGWPDILISNGHVYPQAGSIQGFGPYRQPILLFRNRRDRTFEDVTVASHLEEYQRSWRGVAFGDVDNDGRVDVLIADADGPPVLLLNRTPGRQHAVLFHLKGTKSNAAAIGARVTVTAGDLTQFNEVRGGTSLFSQNDLRLHFGLGAHEKMDVVEVLWPSGKKDRYSNLGADCIYTLTEDGKIESVPFAAPKD
jgi:hypothetical protein